MDPRTFNRYETRRETALLISIVTPVLNEEAGIRGFLDHLADLEGPFELVIVDGGSSDATVALARSRAATFPVPVRLLSAPRGRSAQMNAGAAAAHGEVLLFLHADCRVPVDSLGAIAGACTAPGVCGGAFTPACDDVGLPARICCAVASTLAARLGVFFGDHGIFVRRDVFFAAGEFPAVPYCEDVEFCRAVRRHGRMVRVNRAIQSSPRRFERVGRTRLTAVYALAVLLSLAGIRPRFLERTIVDRE